MHGVAEEDVVVGVRQAVNVTAMLKIVSASLRCLWFIGLIMFPICLYQKIHSQLNDVRTIR
jgi:hypothetical protein